MPKEDIRRVVRARIGEATLPDVEVRNCMVQAMAGWQFPPITGGGFVKVTYPFSFRAAEAKASNQVRRSAQVPAAASGGPFCPPGRWSRMTPRK